MFRKRFSVEKSLNNRPLNGCIEIDRFFPALAKKRRDFFDPFSLFRT